MREELRGIWSAIEAEDLSAEFGAVLGPNWSEDDCRFHSQETYLIDFKDKAPNKLSEDYGIAIVRLAIAFYNTFGGIIVFGVNDQNFGLSKLEIALNVEAFNNELKRVIGRAVECQLKIFTVPNTDSQISVLLVPKRRHKTPARLKIALGKYPANVLWVRDRHEVVQANATHFSLLYSDRSALPGEYDVQRALPIHKSLPPSPATMHEFLGRDNLMAQMWDWLVFSDRPRLYVHGPGGSGKSTLAHEFARTIAEHGFRIQLAPDERVDYVLYLSAKETEFNPLSAMQQDFSLRQFTDADSQFRQILYHSGHSDEASLESVDAEELSSMLGDLFSSYTGLIVLDDIDALSRRGANRDSAKANDSLALSKYFGPALTIACPRREQICGFATEGSSGSTLSNTPTTASNCSNRNNFCI